MELPVVRQGDHPLHDQLLSILRTVSLLAAFLYVTFGWLIHYVFGMDDRIPLVHRLLFAAAYGGVVLLSYVYPRVGRHMGCLVYALGSASIFHVTWLGATVGFDAGSAIALLLVIPMMNFLFYHWTALLYANGLFLVGIVGAFMATASTSTQAMLWAAFSLTIGGVSFWFAQRLASAEQKARQSAQLFHELFYHSMEGMAIQECVFNDAGECEDYVFLGVNPTFEAYSGVATTDVVGKRATEVLPEGKAKECIAMFGQVVRTGEPVSYEQFSKTRQRYYRVAAYPIGGNRFSTAYDDITDRIRAEKKAKAQSALISSLLDSIPDIVFYKDVHGVYLGCNYAFSEYVGIPQEEIVGMTDYQLYPKAVADESRRYDRLTLELGGPRRNEEVITYPDGREVVVDTLKTPYRGPDDHVIGILGISRDISQRKKLEHDRQVHLRFHELVADASAVFVRVTTDVEFDRAVDSLLHRLGDLFAADRSYLFQFSDDLARMSNTHEWCAGGVASQMAGLQDQSMDALPWWKERILQSVPVHVPDVAQLPEAAEAEHTEFSSQGIRSVIFVPTTGAKGYVSGCIGFDMVQRTYCWTDEQITMLQIVADTIGGVLERRRAERALLESESRKEALISAMPDMLFVFDADGVVLDCIAPTPKQLLVPRETAIGRPVAEFLPDDLRRTCMRHLAELFRTERNQSFEYELIVGGASRCYEARFVLCKESSALCIVRDVTERVQAERKLGDYAVEMELREMEISRLYGALTSEMDSAKRAHERLVQRGLPSVDGLSLAAVYQPATYIGGDCFTVNQIGEQLVLHVSDVTGHGLEGTVFGLFVKGCIDSYLELAPGDAMKPGRIISYLDRQLRKSGYPSEWAVSVFIIIIDVKTYKATFSAAGFHNPPVLVHKDGSMERLVSKGLPISQDIPPYVMEFGDHYTNIPEEAVLFLSTDGLYEQVADGVMYEQRALDVLVGSRDLPADTLADVMRNDFIAFMDDQEQMDDVTFLILSTAGRE